MSCAVGVGVAVTDVATVGTALSATGVIIVGAVVAAGVTGAVIAGVAAHQALEQKKLDGLLKRMAQEEISTVVLDREGLKQHKVHERLSAANVAEEFEHSDVIMETAKGEIIGFAQQDDGSYTLNAKYGADGVEEWTGSNEQIEQRIKQQYAYVKVKQEAEKRGYTVVEEEILEDNTIRVHVRGWG